MELPDLNKTFGQLSTNDEKSNLPSIDNLNKFFMLLQTPHPSEPLSIKATNSIFKANPETSGKPDVILDKIVKILIDEIWFEISQITENIRINFNKASDNFKIQINKIVSSYQTNDIAKIKSDYQDSLLVLEFFRNLQQNKNLTDDYNYISLQLKVLSENVDHVGNVQILLSRCQYLNYFKSMNQQKIPPKPWIQLINSNVNNMDIVKNKIENAIKFDGLEKLKNKTQKLVENFEKLFISNLRNKLKNEEFPIAIKEAEKMTLWISEFVSLINKYDSRHENLDKINLLLVSMDISSEEYNQEIFQLFSNFQKTIYLCNLNQNFHSYCNNNNLYKTSLEKFGLETTKVIRWYTFLNSLFEKLSVYEFQKNKEKYVADFKKWGFNFNHLGINITKDKFKLFLDKIYIFNLDFNIYLALEDYDNIRMEELNNVLRYYLNAAKITCEVEKLVLTGNVLTSSELAFSIKNACYNKRSVDIFVTDTLFIDADLNLEGSNYQLNIIVPKIEVIGKRIINLNGSKGKNGSNLIGLNGDAGFPGGSAGHFFGLAMNAENLNNLTILANGGQGGNGFNGAVGRNGTSGRNADTNVYTRKEFYDEKVVMNFLYNHKKRFYRHFGYPGVPGSDGGNGGASGLGGYPGLVQFINLKKDLYPIQENKPGISGDFGHGGNAGMGGKDGNNYITVECLKLVLGITVEKNICEKYSEEVQSRAKEGEHGIPGAYYGTQAREPLTNKEFENSAQILNNYKTHFLKDIDNRFFKTDLIQFLTLIGSNVMLQTNYDSNSAMDEYNNIEKQLKYLTNETAIYLYQELLNKIDILKKKTNVTQEQQKLAYLYTAVLFRKHLSRPKILNILVWDLPELFSSMYGDMESNKIYNRELWGSYLKKYEKILTERINQINLLISDLLKDLELEQKTALNKLKEFYEKLKINENLPNEDFQKNFLLLETFKNLYFAIGYANIIYNTAFLIDPKRDTQKTIEEFISNQIKIIEKENIQDEDFVTIKEFINQENNVNNYLIIQKSLPNVKNIENILRELRGEITLKRDFSQNPFEWKISSKLLDLHFEFQKQKKIFGKNVSIFDKFSEAIVTVSNVYEGMKNIFDLVELEYNLQNWEKISSEAGLTLKNELNKLNETIIASVGAELSQHGGKTFAQSVFPFGQIYLKNLANTALDQAKKLKLIRELLEGNFKDKEKYLTKKYFGNESNSPFYVWKNEYYHSEIIKLLNGEKVYLYSDVYTSDLSNELITLLDFQISLQAKNNSNQFAVNEVLKNFDIIATHFGSSYYVVKKTLYMLEREKIEIQYSFEKKENGMPLRDNGELQKIQNGQTILSPYTTWQFQLTPVNSSINFAKLSQYHNDIDLELSGLGSYIDENAALPFLDLNNYYTAMDKRSMLFLVEQNRVAFEKDSTVKIENGNHPGLNWAQSSAAKPTFFLTDIKNYVVEKINNYFDWTVKNFGNCVSYDVIPTSNIIPESRLDINETILLTQLVAYSFLKDKRTFKNSKSFLPSLENESFQIAKNVLPLINQAYEKYTD